MTNWKKLIPVMALVAVLLTCAAFLPGQVQAEEPEIIDSGYCGDYNYGDGTKVTWTLDSAGTLTISGAGRISSYSYDNGAYPGWYDYLDTIKTVNVEEGITRIGSEAFRECFALSEVRIADSVTSIGPAAFSYCTGLTEFSLPINVTSIAYHTFLKSGLTSITLHNMLTAIGEEAFSDCYNLTSIEIPNSVTEINNNAFKNCVGLTSITIPDSVTRIGKNGILSGCSKLESLTIPFIGLAKEPSLSEDKFPFGAIFGTVDFAHSNYITQHFRDTSDSSGSYYWKDITYYIPSSLKSVTVTGGKYTERAFLGCYSISSVSLGEGVSGSLLRTFEDCSRLTDLTLRGDLELRSNDLKDCKNLCTVQIGGGITAVPNNYFSEKSILQSVIMDDHITRIGDGAFMDCPALTELLIPETVTEIGAEAFKNCSALTSINIPEAIVQLNKYLFMGCTELQEVQLPSKLTTICSGVFWKCSSLATITIPDTVTTIESDAFNECISLISIQIPDSVTTIGSGAFNECTNLKSIKLPSGLTEITYGLFTDCASLEEIHIPDHVQSIGASAFEGCSKLTAVSIPSGVTSIPNSTFAYCDSLSTVSIPDNVTSIGWAAFYQCSSLSSVRIPSGVTEIRMSAFGGCTSLTEITFLGDAPTINSSAFNDVTATAYYPARNETWTEEVKQDYGGSITWSANCFGDHTWGEWETVKEPTIEEPGEEQLHCLYCDCFETREIPKLEFIYGDANGDREINGKDLILLRQSLAGWDVTLTEAAADCNADGTVNGKDLILLRQHLAGWEVVLGSNP